MEVKQSRAEQRLLQSHSADAAVGGAAAASSPSGQLSYCVATCDPPFTRWDVTTLSRVCCPRVGESSLVLARLHGPEAALFLQTRWSRKITSDHTVDLMPRAQLLLLRSGGDTRK